MTRLNPRRPLARDPVALPRRRPEDSWSRLSYALLGASALCFMAATVASVVG